MVYRKTKSTIMWNSKSMPSVWQTAGREAAALSMVLKNCSVWVSPSGQLKAPRCNALPRGLCCPTAVLKERQRDLPHEYGAFSLATSNEFHYQQRWRQGLHFLTSGWEPQCIIAEADCCQFSNQTQTLLWMAAAINKCLSALKKKSMSYRALSGHTG